MPKTCVFNMASFACNWEFTCLGTSEIVTPPKIFPSDLTPSWIGTLIPEDFFYSEMIYLKFQPRKDDLGLAETPKN